MHNDKFSLFSQVTLDFLDAEIESMERKHGENSIAKEVERGRRDRATAILTQELGEVAKAAMDLSNFDQANYDRLNSMDTASWTERHDLSKKLKMELIQVAACALAWSEVS